MSLSRRQWLASVAASALATCSALGDEPPRQVTIDELDEILSRPVLDLSSVTRPVKIRSLELLRNGSAYLIRARSTDGVESVTVPNPARMAQVYPFFLRSVAPMFVGRDARELEQLHWEVYRHQSNYKMQGIALWSCVAAVEMALLNLLGLTANRPVADFFGGMRQRDIAVYVASGRRGNSPEAEVEYLQELVAESGAQALKFRVGGRMSRNADDPPGRSQALIPLVRKTFGDNFTLYADANSSYYDAEPAIRLGRLMEEHGYGFFEEPCEFDDLWSTKKTADALTIPVAGGEQEFSMHRWKWAIAERGLDIVQPDLHYGGGFIRATQVARMAAAAGMTVVPHMSGGGLGYLDVVHFASFTPNIGPFMEFKGNTALPVECHSSSLKCEQGKVQCPTGPGLGVNVAEDFVTAAQPVSQLLLE